MTSLLSCLQWLDYKPVRGLLHLNPWDSVAADWAAGHSVQTIVLAGAGVSCRQDLRRLAAKRNHLKLVDRAVDATGEGGLWRRFNISTLDGWLKPDPAGQVYPRLRLVEEEERQAIDLATLLGELGFRKTPGEATLLILELPGRELAVLSSLDPSLLRTFDYILIKSVREGVYLDANTPQATVQHMESLAYRIQVEDLTNPQWPVLLFQFDQAVAERDALRAEVHVLNTRLDDQAQLIAQQKTDLERLRRELVEQQTASEEALARLLKDLQQAVEEQQSFRQLGEQLSATRVQLDAVRSEKANLERVIRTRAGWLAKERQRLREAERQQNQSSQQQSLLRDELVKAEAQIDFIKEITLRREQPR